MTDYQRWGRKFASNRGDLVPVEVDVTTKGGASYKSVRWKKPADAAKLVAEGKGEVKQQSTGQSQEWAARTLKERSSAAAQSTKDYSPDPHHDSNNDGVTDAARVGICGSCSPPPPPIPRLPNLSHEDRAVETAFADAFETNTAAMTHDYYKDAEANGYTFSTDDAKEKSPHYNSGALADKGHYNTAVHQTANAIAKRAFLARLDELATLPDADPKKQVLVTSGGVASGKGYAIKNVPAALELKKQIGATWDAAGEQNGTENPWVLAECEKRGVKATFVYVDADPKVTWADPQRGMVERSKREGRVVDARLFADSYEIGAKNFAAFKRNTGDRASFMVINSRGSPPTMEDKVSQQALSAHAEKIYAEALKAIESTPDLPDHVRAGATKGRTIWRTK